MAKLVLLFTVVPLCELYLLLLIDDLIGLWPTVSIVLVTGCVGAWLARAEGMRVLRQWRRSVVRGAMPDEGVLGGILILLGGALLVTPGIVTDFVGFLLLIPPSRRFITESTRKRLEAKINDGTVRVVNVSDFGGFHSDGPIPSSTRPQNVVMDGEAEIIDHDDDDEEDTDEETSDRRVLH